jgi:hypothetical protein
MTYAEFADETEIVERTRVGPRHARLLTVYKSSLTADASVCSLSPGKARAWGEADNIDDEEALCRIRVANR